MDKFTLLFSVLCLMFIIVKIVYHRSKEDKDPDECDDESFPHL
jgi:hypothetical protein